MKSDLSIKIERNIYAGYNKDILTDNQLCSIIELCTTLLNATDVQTFANQNNKTYNGIKKHHPNYRKIKHFSFVIDNH